MLMRIIIGAGIGLVCGCTSVTVTKVDPDNFSRDPTVVARASPVAAKSVN
jgi:hypothetical protein